MSVPEGKRGAQKMEAFTKANNLAIYTIKICNNKNVFLPEYQNALTNDIISTAKDIFICAWDANGIRVTKTVEGKVVIDERKREERRRLQEISVRKCNSLLAMMQIAQRLFHLPTKRIKYWGGMTIEVRDLLKKWKQSDAKRYEAKVS